MSTLVDDAPPTLAGVLTPVTTESRLVEGIFAEALRLGASDIHLGVGTAPMVRVGGALGAIDGLDPLTADEIEALATWVGGPVAGPTGDRDLAFGYRGARLRANIYRQRGTVAIACRIIPQHVPSFSTLGLPDVVQQMAQLPHGLVLLCGPTGSGKTTTLASMIDIINESRRAHITTIEDPIEYLHRDKRSIIHQREVAREVGLGRGDVTGFAAALRSALRQDPDVILVGEMRDNETIDAALTAAETGHLVLSTLHTGSAESSVGRIVNAFPAANQAEIRARLATVLRGVICQMIMPRADRVGQRGIVTEVMLNNRAISNLIREGHTHQITSQLETSAREGMHTFDQALAEAVASGWLDPGHAVAFVADEPSYRSYLERHR